MKLMIELNCYEELKNIAKTADNKIRKVKRLFYVSCAMIYISVIGMIYLFALSIFGSFVK